MPSLTYFKSEDIKVFPCSYRSYTNDKVFDPEARMLTERNFITAGYNVYGKEDSYILNYADINSGDYLEVIIKGYYFKISNFSSYVNNNWTNLCIKTKEINITSEDRTNVLANLDDNANYLDILNATTNIWEFKGIAMYTPDPNVTDTYNTLIVLNSGNIVNSSKRLNIQLQDLNANSGHIITSADDDTDIENVQSKAITGNKEFKGNVSIIGGSEKTLTVTETVDIDADVDINGNTTITGPRITLTGTTGTTINGPTTIDLKGTLSNKFKIISTAGTSLEVTKGSIALGVPVNTDVYLASGKNIINSNNKKISVPDYNSNQADYVLAVKAGGSDIEWRAPYHETITNAS